MNEERSNELNVRILCGEIWAEFEYRLEESSVDWRARSEVLDIVMGVLARHDGVLLVNDSELPVSPLPIGRKFPDSDV